MIDYLTPILQTSIPLYQYTGQVEDVEGNLTVNFRLSPAPLISWSLVTNIEAPAKTKWAQPAVNGLNFRIPSESSRGGNSGIADRDGVLWFSYGGVSSFAEKGVKPAFATNVTATIPVARFHWEHYFDEGFTFKKDYLLKDGVEKEFPTLTNQGKLFTVQLDSGWLLTIETSSEALHWLGELSGVNTGTLLTTLLHLEYSGNGTKLGVSIDEFERKFKLLCYLLSIANGGFTWPTIVSCYYHDEKDSKKIGRYTRFHASRTTPLEQLGSTWLAGDSDLGAYLRCCACLERMLQNPIWEQAFPVVVNWYFQSIQPNADRYEKDWQIVANALGAALELICDTLSEETPGIISIYLAQAQKAKKDFNNKDRIKAVLGHIGLLNSDWFHQDKFVDSFVDVRNDATHSKQKSPMSIEHRYFVIELGKMWLEELILWRLGYQGEHRARTRQNTIESRDATYNLMARDASW